jgi:FG-GAP-like repeat
MRRPHVDPSSVVRACGRAIAALAVVVVVVAPRAAAADGPLFLPAQLYPTDGQIHQGGLGGAARPIAVEDVNKDGVADLLLADPCPAGMITCKQSTVSVLLGRRDGSFGPPTSYLVGAPHAFTVLVADVNRDHILDILVASGCVGNEPCPDQGSIGVLLGRGDGTFHSARTYATGGSTRSAALADVNGDSRPDVVVANCAGSGVVCSTGSGQVGVLIGNGDGTFQPVVTYDSGAIDATFVASADVDGDGHADLLVTNNRVCDNCQGSIGVLLGRGDGTLEPVQTYPAGLFFPAFMLVTDVNEDGALDVVAADGGELGVLLGRGDGSFGPPALQDTGGQGQGSLVATDVNGDHHIDLLATNVNFPSDRLNPDGCVGVLLGLGDGSFQPVVTYDTGGQSALWSTVADVDGDGTLDVVVADLCGADCTEGGLGVLLGNTDGTFQPPLVYPTGGKTSAWVTVRDVNGDGRPDALVGNVNDGAASISVLLNGGQPFDRCSLANPLLVAAAIPGAAIDLEVDDRYVYFTGPTPAGLYRVSKDGGTPVLFKQVPEPDAGNTRFDYAVDASTVYVMLFGRDDAAPSDGGVYLLGKDGSDRGFISAHRPGDCHTTFVHEIAVGGDGELYWLQSATSRPNPPGACPEVAPRIARIAPGATQATILAPVTPESGHLLADAFHAFWSSEESIWRIPRTGGPPERLLRSSVGCSSGESGCTLALDMAIDANSVYWTSDANGTRETNRIDAPGVSVEIFPDVLGSLRTDGSFLYGWVARTGPGEAANLVRMKPSGHGQRVLRKGRGSEGGVAVDDRFVYYTSSDLSFRPQIVKACKDD